MRRFLITVLVAIPAIVSAQAPAAPAPEGQSTETAAAPSLPVRRVVLYKAGVGYFEHLGNVRNRQDVTVRFTSAQLNDALNSLTVLDLGRGQITGISYNSVAPLQQRLGALRLLVGESTTQSQMLDSLRGSRARSSRCSTRGPSSPVPSGNWRDCRTNATASTRPSSGSART
jgi:hypothetical protein